MLRLYRKVAAISVSALVFLFVSSACHAGDRSAKEFRAGASVVDITPKKFPVSMLGSFHERLATSAHDPLHARCLVLDDGTIRVAMVACDICMVPREVFDEAKRLATERTGIPSNRMLMAATHTHTGSPTTPRRHVEADADYTKFLVRQIAQGVESAVDNLAPAKVGWAVTQVPEEVFNRRWLMKEGSIPPNPFGGIDKVKMNPPRGNPNLVKPAGLTDPDVSVLSLQSVEGRPIAVLANYSLHYVGGVPSGALSADYFGEFAAQIERRLAPDAEPAFVGILTNGTSGDVNNINFRQPRKKSAPFERIRQVAKRVTDAAMEAYQTIEHQDRISLAMAEREIALAVRKPSAQEVQQAHKILAKPDDAGLPIRAKSYASATVRLADYPDTVDIKLQALRIGALGIVAVPCEVFAEIGLEIKEKSPLEPTFTIELANGYNGYLPTPRQHELGGYETWRCGGSYLEVNASRKITETLMELLAEVSQRRP